MIAEIAVRAAFANMTFLRVEASLAVLTVIGAIVYLLALIALFGRNWLARYRRNAGSG